MNADGADERGEATSLRLAFGLVTALVVLLSLEAFAFATRFFTDDLYDHRDAVLERVEAAGFEESRRNADPILGWDERGPKVTRQANCLGEEIEYAVDEKGARIHPGYDGRGVRVLVVGDSYTRGDEADGGDTFPARLAEELGVPVANLGVGGFGPAQSFLRLQRMLPLYPRTEVVVLAIMYENLHRMVNGYRPVLYDKSDPFGFKPHMSGGRIAPHPGAAAFEDVASLRAFASRAFDEDFWSKPRPAFPYGVSLARALGSNFFRFRKFQKAFRSFGVPEYFLSFRSEAFRSELFGLLELYADFAEERGLVAAAVFVPRNRLDTRSASRMLDSSGWRPKAELIVGDVGRAELDWQRFNLIDREEDDICHPSPYGYRGIAAYVADLLRSGRPGPLAGGSR